MSVAEQIHNAGKFMGRKIRKEKKSYVLTLSLVKQL